LSAYGRWVGPDIVGLDQGKRACLLGRPGPLLIFHNSHKLRVVDSKSILDMGCVGTPPRDPGMLTRSVLAVDWPNGSGSGDGARRQREVVVKGAGDGARRQREVVVKGGSGAGGTRRHGGAATLPSDELMGWQ
jgi:hypothetical protein